MTFSSVYEILDPLTTVRKQRFWEWFEGEILHSRWTVGGSASVNAMSNTVDGGYIITTTAVSNNFGSIHFNDKRHYDPRAMIYHVVLKASSTTVQSSCGMVVNPLAITSDVIIIGMRTNFDTSNFIIQSNDGGNSFSSSTVALDTNLHLHSGEFGSSDLKYSIDGVLEATHTTDRPTLKMQPGFFVKTQGTAAAKSGNVIYMEAYST